MSIIKKNIFFVGVVFSAVGAYAQTSPDLKSIMSGEYRPKSVSEFRSMVDGEHYTATDDKNTMIVKYSYKSGKPVDTLFNVSTARECPFVSFDGYELSPDETRLLIYTDPEMIYRRSFKAKYYTVDTRRNLVKPLSSDKQQAALFSPNGRMVAFVRDNNIYLKKLDYNTESAVTTDGKKNEIINGIPDWVYEEEFSMNRAMTWAPDNSSLAFIKFDESEVKEYPMQMFRGMNPSYDENTLYPGMFSYKYPVAGETNSKVSIHSFDIDNMTSRKLNVQVGSDDYMPRVKFTSDPEKLAVVSFNRWQNTSNLHFVNPKSGVSKVVLQDQNDSYINADNMDMINFFEDGFTFASEKSGYRHIYLHNMNGLQVRQLTSGNWDVTDFYGYDPKTKSVYIQAAVESPLVRDIYKVDAKGNMVKLSEKQGTNKAHFSNNFKYFQNYHSSVNTPLEVELYDGKGGRVRTLENNSELKQKLAGFNMPKKDFLQFTTTQGTVLNAYMMKPVDFDPSKKYPVLMTQYSGPGSQSVLNRWELSWLHFLTSKGYIVFCVDGRGTGARGAAFERETYRNLGLKESADQIEGAKYLKKLSYVNPERIGIWGWSFGGYNTLMSLTGSDDFAVGIAVAPVTDWRFYDTIYTERYMRRPQDNDEGYNKTSAIGRAANLKGNLLIITGSADDNVHPQNTYEFTEALVQNNIEFDMHVYTNRNHFINGGNTQFHIYNKMYNYLKKNL